MRVINISHEDFANYSYHNAMAMKSVGIDADAYVLKSHTFRYQSQAIRTSSRDIAVQCERADIIQVMHSCGTMWDIVKHLKGKRIIVWHTGTRYRKDAVKHNGRWNPIIEKSVCALGEFMTLGCKKPEYFGITVNVEETEARYQNRGYLVFGHFPSNKKVKGTAAINAIMKTIKKKGLKHKYNTGNIVHHAQNESRMQDVDVYLEMMAMTQGGRPYGSYGTTAIEAAAMGKIVITNNLWEELYRDTYGKSALIIANSEADMQSNIERLINLPHDEITELQYSSRQWALEKHGYKAQGERMKKVLGL
jgi:hypothetical protein